MFISFNLLIVMLMRISHRMMCGGCSGHVDDLHKRQEWWLTLVCY